MALGLGLGTDHNVFIREGGQLDFWAQKVFFWLLGVMNLFLILLGGGGHKFEKWYFGQYMFYILNSTFFSI